MKKVILNKFFNSTPSSSMVLNQNIDNEHDHGQFPMYKCKGCNLTFYKMYTLLRHSATCNKPYTCTKCKHEFTNTYNGVRHEEVCDKNIAPKKFKIEPTKKELLAINSNENGAVEYETAFQNRLKSFFIRLDDCHDLECYFRNSKGNYHISEIQNIFLVLRFYIITYETFFSFNRFTPIHNIEKFDG